MRINHAPVLAASALCLPRIPQEEPYACWSEAALRKNIGILRKADFQSVSLFPCGRLLLCRAWLDLQGGRFQLRACDCRALRQVTAQIARQFASVIRVDFGVVLCNALHQIRCGHRCGYRKRFSETEVDRELVYNDELNACTWALNSAAECHLHTVTAAGKHWYLRRASGAFSSARERSVTTTGARLGAGFRVWTTGIKSTR